MNTATKICFKCKAGKPATREFFYKKAERLQSWCKECREAFRRLPEETEKLNRQRRERRATNPEKQRQQDRENYHTNERRRLYQINYNKDARKANPQKLRAKDRDQYQKHREKRLASMREWSKKNRDKANANGRKTYAKKMIDPQFRLSQAISSYINYSLRGKKNGAKWESLVGFSLPDLISHLQRQFHNGMSWDNYGKKWHIDHIVPVASFKYSAPQDDEFKACWALTNLRPLWASENIRKRDKRIYLV